MTREVNISLRGFLEDLPAEVAEFLTVTLRKMSDAEHKLNGVIERLEDGQDVNHCVVDLESTRQSLYKIDNRLSDCMSILSGYAQHLNNPPPVPPTASEHREESED